MIDEVYEALLENTKSTPGAKVENNKFCVSVHFRCVDEKRWSPLAEQVKSVLKEYPKLRISHGRKVIEVRPTIKWDKGKALEFLLNTHGATKEIYAPEPFDVGRILHAEMILNDQRVTLMTMSPIDPGCLAPMPRLKFLWEVQLLNRNLTFCG